MCVQPAGVHSSIVHGLPSSQLVPANAIIVCEVLSKAWRSAGGEATVPSVALTMRAYEPGASADRSSPHGSLSAHATESAGAGSGGESACMSIASNVEPAAHRSGWSKSLPPVSSKMSTRCAVPPTVIVAYAQASALREWPGRPVLLRMPSWFTPGPRSASASASGTSTVDVGGVQLQCMPFSSGSTCITVTPLMVRSSVSCGTAHEVASQV